MGVDYGNYKDDKSSRKHFSDCVYAGEAWSERSTCDCYRSQGEVRPVEEISSNGREPVTIVGGGSAAIVGDHIGIPLFGPNGEPTDQITYVNKDELQRVCDAMRNAAVRQASAALVIQQTSEETVELLLELANMLFYDEDLTINADENEIEDDNNE